MSTNTDVLSKAFQALVKSEFSDIFILSADDGVSAIRSGRADMLIASETRSSCILFHDRSIGNEVRIQQLKKYCPDMIWEKGAY